MIENIKDNIGGYSTAALIGAVIPALLSLNIFATRADLAEMKTEIYQNFMSKSDVTKALDDIRLTQKEILKELRGHK